MKRGIQEHILEIGRSGCYFLCLIEIANIVTHKEENPLYWYDEFLTLGYIKRNCFVEFPYQILERLTNKYVSFRSEAADYKPIPDEFVIKRFVLKQGNGALTHFVLYDDADTEIFNPLPESPAYKFGKVDGCRVFEVGK